MNKVLPFILQGINVFATALLGFLFLPLISNYLSVSDVGLYAQLLSVLSLGLLIVGSGTTNYNYRFLNNNNIHNYKKSIVTFLFFLSVSAITIYIYFIFSNKFSNEDLIIVLILLMIFGFYKYLHSIIYANQQHKEYVVLNLTEAVIRYFSALLLIIFGYRYIAYFIGNLISAITVVIIAIILIRKKLLLNSNNIKRADENHHTLLYAFKYTSLYTVSGISIWILTSIDILLVGIYLGNEKAGIYSLGYTLGFQIITFVLMVINNVYEPKLLSKETVGLKEYRFISTIFIYITVPLILFMYFNIDTYYKLFIDQEFAESSKVTILILCSSLFWGIYKLCSIKFARDLKPGTYTRLVIIASVINLILNIILINKFGIIGAAISSLSAYLFLAIMALLQIYNLVALIKYILKTLVITVFLFIVMGIIKEYTYNNWIAQLGQIFVTLIYYFMFYIFIGRKYFEKKNLFNW